MKVTRWIWAVVALASCAHPIEGPLKAASSDMSCPPERVDIKELSEHEASLLRLVSGPTTVVAMGCGRAQAYARMCTVPDVADVDPKCDWYPVRELKARELRKRAAFDANCAVEQLAFHDIDDATEGVLGCGQRLSYSWVCPHSSRLFSSACHWVLDAASRPVPAADPRSVPPQAPATAPSAPPPARPTEI